MPCTLQHLARPVRVIRSNPSNSQLREARMVHPPAGGRLPRGVLPQAGAVQNSSIRLMSWFGRNNHLHETMMDVVMETHYTGATLISYPH